MIFVTSINNFCSFIFRKLFVHSILYLFLILIFYSLPYYVKPISTLDFQIATDHLNNKFIKNVYFNENFRFIFFFNSITISQVILAFKFKTQRVDKYIPTAITYTIQYISTSPPHKIESLLGTNPGNIHYI